MIEVGSVGFDGNEGFVGKMGGLGEAADSGGGEFELGLTVELELGSDGDR